MKIVEAIKAIVAGLFPVESANAEKIGWDPFSGHTEDSRKPGKSYFGLTTSNQYLGTKDGEEAYAEIAVAAIKAEVVKIVRDDDEAKIEIYKIMPTQIAEDRMGAYWVRPAKDAEEEVSCGYSVTGRAPYEKLTVNTVHGCLQICAKVVDEDEEETSEFTIVRTNEGPNGWVIASVYPGRPEGGIGDYLKECLHYKSWLDKDYERPPVKGYKDGEEFNTELLVEKAPDWVLKHITSLEEAVGK